MTRKKAIAKNEERAAPPAPDDPFLAEVIAMRDYESPTGARVRVVIRKPEPAPEGDWRCAFEITGLDAPMRQRAFGVDGMQALGCAMLMLRALLESVGRELTLLGGAPGDLGLPLIVHGDREQLAIFDAAVTLERRRLEWAGARTTCTPTPRRRR